MYSRYVPTNSSTITAPFVVIPTHYGTDPEEARTLNLWIDSPQQQIDKPQDDKDLETHNSGDYKPAYKENSKMKVASL